VIFTPDSKIVRIEGSAFTGTPVRSLVLPPTIRHIRASAIPSSCELICDGIDATLGFSTWNSSRCRDSSLAIDWPSPPADQSRVRLNQFIVRLEYYIQKKEFVSEDMVICLCVKSKGFFRLWWSKS
jgi:hypothetical protein